MSRYGVTAFRRNSHHQRSPKSCPRDQPDDKKEKVDDDQ
jgi:hypothetical protein